MVFLIDAIYPTPQYQNFCSEQFFPTPIKIPTPECPNINSIQIEQNCFKQKGEVRYNYGENGCPKEAYCELCVRDYQDANSNYNKNIFYISAILGLIAIIVGLYLPKNLDPISSGLIFAGILILAQGTIRVFGSLGKVPRVIILGIELALIIWIGYKKVIRKK